MAKIHFFRCFSLFQSIFFAVCVQKGGKGGKGNATKGGGGGGGGGNKSGGGGAGGGKKGLLFFWKSQNINNFSAKLPRVTNFFDFFAGGKK